METLHAFQSAFRWFLLIVLLCTFFAGFQTPAKAAMTPPCEKPGWFPEEFGLKDHTVFWYDGYYYIAAIYVTPDNQFAYGRSKDLCNWEELTPILSKRTPGTWDESLIWAPYVYEEAGIYYMYYTGVTSKFTQSILLATSDNPADPNSWTPREMVFYPTHAGAVWQDGQWANCRDPMVFRQDGTYYLYYMGQDEAGYIIGVAQAASLTGPWEDLGSVFPAMPDQTPESPTLASYGGYDYLFYNDSSSREVYRVAESPLGPWGKPVSLIPGWAHEVWQDVDGNWFSSYLTDYTVSISPLTWDSFFTPARPFIASQVSHMLLPVFFGWEQPGFRACPPGRCP